MLVDLRSDVPNVLSHSHAYRKESRNTTAQHRKRHAHETVSRLLQGVSADNTKDADWELKVGAMLENTVMHEVGHGLGLRHNFRGSAGTSVECLRNASCTAANGTSISVMDYVPVNIF